MAKILKEIAKRAKQKSTWLGLGLLATILGVPEVGDKLGQVGEVVGLVVGAGAVAVDK